MVVNKNSNATCQTPTMYLIPTIMKLTWEISRNPFFLLREGNVLVYIGKIEGHNHYFLPLLLQMILLIFFAIV